VRQAPTAPRTSDSPTLTAPRASSQAASDLSPTSSTRSATCRLRHRPDPRPVAYATDPIRDLSPTPPTANATCRLRHRHQ